MSSPAALSERMPYLRFEYRPVENRNKSIQAGHPVYDDELFVLVTPSGTKDSVERVAKDWITIQLQQVTEGRLPRAWYDAYKNQMDAFIESREVPLEGISILNWPGVTPAQVKLLLDLNIRTVEDLAVLNEEGIANIGMGGRGLKQKAIDYLKAAAEPGKVSEELVALKMSNEILSQDNKQLRESLAQLTAQVEVLMRAQTTDIGSSSVSIDNLELDKE